MKKKKISKTNAIRQMERSGISFTIHEYAWKDDALDAQSAAEDGDKPLHKVFKTLVATGDRTGEVVACIQAGKELDLKKLAKVSGNKKVEMLKMRDLEAITGYVRGGCSPVGMKKLFPTYIDQAAEGMDTMIVSAGKRGMQVEVLPSDMQKLTEAVFSPISVG